MEQDNEVSGNGNAIVFKYRIHDPRLGRFLSVDPLESEYPWNSSYAFAENTPIAFIDLEGAEKFEATTEAELDNGGTPTGNTIIKLKLNTSETMTEQRKAGMATISWDGGEYTNNFKYQFIQEVLGNSKFLDGDLIRVTGLSADNFVKLNSGGNPNKAGGYNSASAADQADAPPQFNVQFTVGPDKPKVQTVKDKIVLTGVAAAKTGDEGMAGGSSEGGFKAGLSVSSILTYKLGDEEYSDYTWDISVVEDGKVVWSKKNATTGGNFVTEDISSSLSLGQHDLSVIVTQSEGSVTPSGAGSGGGVDASGAGSWDFELSIETENIEEH
jgi:RHS repeat-associated protein